MPLQKLAGEYTDALHGDVSVTYESGRLHLRYGSAFVGTLAHWHYDTFRAVWKAAWREPALVTLSLGEDGKPAALELMSARFTRKTSS